MFALAVACKEEPKAPAAPPPQPKPVEAPAPTAAADKAVDPNDKLDGDMKEVLVQLAALNGKPIETLSPVEARQQPTPAEAVTKLLAAKGKPTDPELTGAITNKDIGNGVSVRIYSPKESKGPMPIVVYYHGGGFVIATIDTYDASARALANGAEAIVVAVEYRKAPENKFPAAHDDAIAAYQWVLKNAKTFGGDAKRVALVGESAGGNLAANVAIAARDKKLQAPLYQVLVYPVASNDMHSASYIDSANAKPLNAAMMTWFTEKYFRSATDANDPRINLVAANLAGLPPTLIINAEVDPLRTDGEVLAKALEKAGVKTKQKTYEGTAHEFFGMGAVVDDAKTAMALACDELEDALDKKSGS